MADSSILPIWDPKACIPREEVLKGTLTDADLALRLNLVIEGQAKAPYNDPRTFFEATYMTPNMKEILSYLFGRLSRARPDSNPVVVLDVGFGGGKTHTLVALYYAAQFGNDPAVRKFLTGIAVPKKVKIVAISGEEYGEAGLKRNTTPISTLWGDLFYQLGVYSEYKKMDLKREVPSLQDVKSALGDDPLLIMLDELPTYFNLVGKHDSKMMDQTVQFIQRLILAVSEKENAALVIALAEDAYKTEAILIRDTVSEQMAGSSEENGNPKKSLDPAAIAAMDSSQAHINRKATNIPPAEEEDTVFILKKRLFSFIDSDVAKQVADAYHSLYSSLPVPEKYKQARYQERIEESYPFHPELIEVLYERIAPLEGFHRTRGALRLLNRVVRQIWKEKESDGTLIHPFHIDFATPGITEELTIRIGESRMRNAIEADIARTGSGATAQELDQEVKAQWKAPLHRRTCNTIYLYSIASGKEGDRGIGADDLITIMAVPDHSDYALRVRDSVFRKLSSDFHYIDRQGTNYLFIREPNPLRIIDREAKNITDQEATDIVKQNLESLFNPLGQPDWVHINIFPPDPSKVEDMSVIKLAVLNPHLHHVLPDSGDIPENIKRFITHNDSQGKRFRKFKNDTFLLVAEQSRLDILWDIARKLKSAKVIRADPAKYGIPKDRKIEVEDYYSDKEKIIHDHVRTAFNKFIYFDKKGEIQSVSLNANGYSGGKSGKEMFLYHLRDVFRRISTESFDPALVQADAWSPGAPFISTQTLFETFHIKPGLVIPATKKTFQETIIRGLNENYWILRNNEIIYSKDNLPQSIGIDQIWEVWNREDAVKQGLLEKKVGEKKLEYGETKRKTKTVKGPQPFNWSFQESPADVLAKDLETYGKRERVSSLNTVIIKTSDDPSALYAIKNVITKLGPEENCQFTLQLSAQRYSQPKYTINADFAKQDMNEASVKAFFDFIPKLHQNAEQFNLVLSLNWEGATIDKISKTLRDIKKTSGDTLFTLEISGIKEVT